jgi:hypothetical protein
VLLLHTGIFEETVFKKHVFPLQRDIEIKNLLPLVYDFALRKKTISLFHFCLFWKWYTAELFSNILRHKTAPCTPAAPFFAFFLHKYIKSKNIHMRARRGNLYVLIFDVKNDSRRKNKLTKRKKSKKKNRAAAKVGTQLSPKPSF